MKKYPGSISRPIKDVGDLITVDHCSFYDNGVNYALNGNTVSLVVRDIATAFLGMCTHCQSKTIADTVSSLQRFSGYAVAKRFYADNADGLISAARFLKIPHEASQQGIPRTNCIINARFRTRSPVLAICWLPRGYQAIVG